ncbi:hypothetical protein JXB41_03795 [Candidatus Woesearchaeota archaeon]|nr:hypothetical protein [Candidatus Woesearchaeota archaeon]
MKKHISLKEKIINKLFYTNTVVIDKPGILIHKFYVGFGLFEIKRRMAYFFEDPLVDIHINVEKKLGKKKTEEIFYKIGKDIGVKFISQMFNRKMPKAICFTFFERVLEKFSFLGYSITDIVKFDKKNLHIVLRGKDNIICRKCGIGHIYSGLLSGILSSLLKENIEAKKTKCCFNSDYCEIVIDKNFSKEYFPEKEMYYGETKEYEKTNFPEDVNYTEKFSSFYDLVKFKKAFIDNYGKYYFVNKSIIATDINFPSIIANRLIYFNLKHTVEKSLKSSSERVFLKVMPNFKKQDEKINFLKNFLSALGWGTPFFEKSKKLKCTFIYPPRSKYRFHYFAYSLNGFVNAVYGRDFNLSKIDESNQFKTIVEFE